MSYTYIEGYHHGPVTFEFDTLHEAIQMALVCLDNGDSWPEQIVSPKGVILWEHSGPLTTAASLNRFADDNGYKNECRDV